MLVSIAREHEAGERGVVVLGRRCSARGQEASERRGVGRFVRRLDFSGAVCEDGNGEEVGAGRFRCLTKEDKNFYKECVRLLKLVLNLIIQQHNNTNS